jgi:outer membrane protein OmpA-like peptidoglycan-associated protein/tetratricopeptide (TPR) repeat protein
MKRILNILLLLLLSTQMMAQSSKASPKRILKQANKQFSLLKYAYAIPLYKNYLIAIGNKVKPSDSIVYKNLGEAYRLVNEYDSALAYYQKAVNKGVVVGNKIAELQAMVGDYENAQKEYKAIVANNRSLFNDSRLYGFSNVNKFYADSLDFKIYPTKLNTPYNEFNAVPFKEGIVFESNRVITKKIKKRTQIVSKEFAWDGAGYSRLFYVKSTKDIRIDTTITANWRDKKVSVDQLLAGTSNDTRLLNKPIDFNVLNYKQDSIVSLFGKELGLKLNMGAVSFTEDGKTAYFTRNGRNTKKGYLLEIWEAKFREGKWTSTGKLFFNKQGNNYFHPAITPNGQRLYYVSDEAGGYGGTDIYFIEKNSDGSWRPTSNVGQVINTIGNELFPSFHDGTLFFSSNGHPGIGGLDIYRLATDARGDATAKNLGYPVNSNKDDLGFSINGNAGYFSSNRYGSDDIFAFDYAQTFIVMNGRVTVDSINAPGKKVYLTQRTETGRVQIVDSATVDANGAYAFKARPNKEYTIVTYDNDGDKFETSVKSNDFVKNNDSYTKQVNVINIPLSQTELTAKKAQQDALIAQQEKQNLYNKMYAKTVDSLMNLSKDYVELHHPFNQVFIIKKDLAGYEKLINRVKNMKGREIVIVSATDCNGTDEYNEDLSQRRAKRIFKTLNALSNNKVVIRHVGERELLKACDDVKKSIEEQVVNRYSYVFILNKK